MTRTTTSCKALVDDLDAIASDPVVALIALFRIENAQDRARLGDLTAELARLRLGAPGRRVVEELIASAKDVAANRAGSQLDRMCRLMAAMPAAPDAPQPTVVFDCAFDDTPAVDQAA